jgi:soluble lytic murein transglycosylase-like protein
VVDTIPARNLHNVCHSERSEESLSLQFTERPSRSLRNKCCALLIAFLLSALPAFASQLAVLRNGFSIRHQRRAEIGPNTRLFITADGLSFVDVPTAQIDHYEAAPEPTAPESIVAPTSTTRRAAPVAKAAEPLPSVDELVASASTRYRMDPDLVNSVIRAESGFNVRARSPKGAQGLMQLMPGTASKLGVNNAYDPRSNVDGGTKYLRQLLEKYNFDLVKALAAYNAGPERVDKFGGVPPFHETHVYVAHIVRDFNRKKIAQQKAAKAKNPPPVSKPQQPVPSPQ